MSWWDTIKLAGSITTATPGLESGPLYGKKKKCGCKECRCEE